MRQYHIRCSTSPRRKRIRPGLISDLSVTNAIFASIVLTRPVQIPCRSFWQVIDAAYLCRTRTDNIKTLCLLLTYCYDIFVILSEAKDLCTLECHLGRPTGLNPPPASRTPPLPAPPSDHRSHCHRALPRRRSARHRRFRCR